MDTAARYCWSCGEPASGGRFCSQCGKPLAGPGADPDAEPRREFPSTITRPPIDPGRADGPRAEPVTPAPAEHDKTAHRPADDLPAYEPPTTVQTAHPDPLAYQPTVVQPAYRLPEEEPEQARTAYQPAYVDPGPPPDRGWDDVPDRQGFDHLYDDQHDDGVAAPGMRAPAFVALVLVAMALAAAAAYVVTAALR